VSLGESTWMRECMIDVWGMSACCIILYCVWPCTSASMEALDIAIAVVCYACRHIADSHLLDWKVSVPQSIVFSKSRFWLRSDQYKLDLEMRLGRREASASRDRTARLGTQASHRHDHRNETVYILTVVHRRTANPPIHRLRRARRVFAHGNRTSQSSCDSHACLGRPRQKKNCREQCSRGRVRAV